MEFFLARALHRALVAGRLDQWAVPVSSLASSRNAWRWLRWHAPLPDGRHWMHYPMDAFRGRQEGDG